MPRTRSVGPNRAIPMTARIASTTSWKTRRAAIHPRPKPNPVANGPLSLRSEGTDPDREYHCGLATYTGRDGVLPGKGKASSRSRARAADGAAMGSTRADPNAVPQRSQNDAPGRGRVRHLTHGAPGRFGGDARRAAPILISSDTSASRLRATDGHACPSRTNAHKPARTGSSGVSAGLTSMPCQGPVQMRVSPSWRH